MPLPLVYACIAPHGDEMVPELAGGTQALAAETTEGMLRLAAEMKRARPDTIVIATPHNLRLLRKIGVVVAENSSGRVVAGDKSISLQAKCDVDLAFELLSSAEGAGIPVVGANYGTESGPLSNLAMDWGTLIPLWFFLRLNRLGSKIVIVTPSREIPLEENFRFGVKVAEWPREGRSGWLSSPASIRPTHTPRQGRTVTPQRPQSTTGGLWKRLRKTGLRTS